MKKITSSVLLVATTLLTTTNSVGAPSYTPPDYVFSPDIPHDIIRHNEIAMQDLVDVLAWQSFIAINWPLPDADKLTQRGVPDRQKIIGGRMASPFAGGDRGYPPGPVVWESYKDSMDLFVPKNGEPSPFDTNESIPSVCQDLAEKHPEAAARTLTEPAKIVDVPHLNKQAMSHGRLIDQNGEMVWYDIKVNRAYYDFVVKNKYYDSSVIPKTVVFPHSSNTTGNPAPLKIKAAWKVMGDKNSKQPDDTSKFYTTEALIYNKGENGNDDTCEKKLMGLVGLHVVMKTEQLPQWMWATFEHVDNAPTQGERVSGQYNFYKPDCQDCKVNVPPSDNDDTPTQVLRITPIDKTAQDNNLIFQTALKTLREDNVWANYMLVDAQWGADNLPKGVPNQPKFLANTTMETYMQGNSNNINGCINCHGAFAGDHDLDFQLPESTKKSLNLTSNQPTYIRKDAHSEAAQADLKALEVALEKMRNMPCDNPLSWYYQGAIHAIPGNVPNNRLCPSYQNIRTDLKWGWNTCTHQTGSEIHFLLWHRIYLMHFEKIVRKLSGKADFALPYWHYTDKANQVLPKMLRNKSSALYTPSRLSSLNQGVAIHGAVKEKLDVKNLMENTDFATFNSTIDGAPHGAMHVYIGGGYSAETIYNPIYQQYNVQGLMGKVPSAGFDPVFWLHHGEIDFLWEQWDQSEKGERPTLADLEQASWPYQFYDENGNTVEYTVKEAYEKAFNTDYQYDRLLNKSKRRLTADNTIEKRTLLTQQIIGKSLLNGDISVTPKRYDGKRLNVDGEIVLKINTSFTQEPKDSYSVYLVDDENNKHTIGVMTFFGAAHHVKHRLAEGEKPQKTFLYDISQYQPLVKNYHIVIDDDREQDSGLTIEAIELYHYWEKGNE